MTAIEQLSCQELVELITDYLEGALDAERRARFDQHIGRCGGCRTYVEQMRATIAVAGRLSAETIDPRVEAELLAAFRSWKSE